jgi:hypothetical protein
MERILEHHLKPRRRAAVHQAKAAVKAARHRNEVADHEAKAAGELRGGYNLQPAEAPDGNRIEAIAEMLDRG